MMTGILDFWLNCCCNLGLENEISAQLSVGLCIIDCDCQSFFSRHSKKKGKITFNKQESSRCQQNIVLDNQHQLIHVHVCFHSVLQYLYSSLLLSTNRDESTFVYIMMVDLSSTFCCFDGLISVMTPSSINCFNQPFRLSV